VDPQGVPVDWIGTQEVADGYGARVMVLSSGNRLFMLGVHARRGTDRLYAALVASLNTSQ